MQRVLNQKVNELNEITKITMDQEKILLEAERYLQNISYQSNMLLTLINDLLDLAKVETMNFQFNEEFFDMNQLITQAYDTVKYQAASKKISIIKEYLVQIDDPVGQQDKVKLNYDKRLEYFKNMKGDKLRYM